jgi:proteasome assembly chaperone (PAC2) family protein
MKDSCLILTLFSPYFQPHNTIQLNNKNNNAIEFVMESITVVKKNLEKKRNLIILGLRFPAKPKNRAGKINNF